MISKKIKPTKLIFTLAVVGLLFIAIKYLNPNSLTPKNLGAENTVIQSSDLQKNPSAVTATTSSASNNTSAALTDPQAEEQVRIVEEILKTHNDNDPRMDKQLLVLSENTKIRFRELYKKIPAEKRNDRGTIVFLLGRNISEPADLNFFNEVLNEPPCRSLADCSKTETGGRNKEEDEHQGGFATTLAYPQLVTLLSLDSFMDKNSKSPLAEQVKDLIEGAKHSPIPEISNKANAIENKFAH